MRLTRVYLPPTTTALQRGSERELPSVAGEHVVRVMRLRPGAELTVFDGSGGEWSAEIVSIARNSVRVRCIEFAAVERESPMQLTLLQSLARGEKMDWIIQKATELGVQRIVPVDSERSVVQFDEDRAGKRLQHWRAVAASACEQCGRNRLPSIDLPQPLPAALNAAGDGHRFILEPGAARTLATAAIGLKAAVVLIGPEGGFTAAELNAAQQATFEPVSFGPRILRTETAAVAAITVLQSVSGDFGG